MLDEDERAFHAEIVANEGCLIPHRLREFMPQPLSQR
jgi:hypothetical protein